MPSLSNVALCAVFQLALATYVGLPVTRRLVPQRAVALALAPAMGWALFSTLALPILLLTGFSRLMVSLLYGMAIAGSSVALLFSGPAVREPARIEASIPWWLFIGAGLVAVAVALGVWPKVGENSLVLADPMFDHSKIAIIDDIVRLGLPPGNPFYGRAAPSGLAYYYLWHFSAAALAAALGASGWEADIALTWFTAFASLALMAGIAVWLSGRSLAAVAVMVLSLAASLSPVLRLGLTPDFLGRLLSSTPGPHSWIFQATWVPQHMASASCVILAVVIMCRLTTPHSWPFVPLLAVVAAAGFECSVWVGGVVFSLSAVAIGIALLVAVDGTRSRLDLAAKGFAALGLMLLIASPLLGDEYAAAAVKHVGSPIALHPFEVLGPLVPDPLRRILDLPAYWFVLLVIEWPAVAIAGTAAIASALRDRERLPAERRLIVALALTAGASLVIPWLFASTIANNDLGWRGVLPGILVLTSFTGAGLARWLATAPKRALAAIVCLILGIPGGLAVVADNAVGRPLPSSVAFAETPALWQAVRRYTAPSERIANNPLFFADSVQWPINVSWALLADRRSCFAGWNLARPFVSLPAAEIDWLEALFDRVFAGDGSPQDIDRLATRYDCRVVVLTARDGAWNRDPFAGDDRFHLVDDETGKWRIYRVVGRSGEDR
jgi:hypothetical protein